MKLYYSDTLSPRKACAVALHVDAPAEFVYVDLGKGEHKTAAFRGMNPNAKVPVLEDGPVTLWESNAIMCRLAARAGSDLWPKDGDRQIDIVRWLSWDSEHFTRHGGALYFEHIIRERFGAGDPDAAQVKEALSGFRKAAAVLDAHLSGRDWLVGDGLTVADFAVAVALPYATEAHIPIGDFPNVARWHERLERLPAWRDPFRQIAEAA